MVHQSTRCKKLQRVFYCSISRRHDLVYHWGYSNRAAARSAVRNATVRRSLARGRVPDGAPRKAATDVAAFLLHHSLRDGLTLRFISCKAGLFPAKTAERKRAAIKSPREMLPSISTAESPTQCTTLRPAGGIIITAEAKRRNNEAEIDGYSSASDNLRREVLAKLVEEGHQVTVLCQFLSHREALEQIGCRLYDIPIGRRNTNPLADLRLLYNFFSDAEKNKPGCCFYKQHKAQRICRNRLPRVGY